MLFFIKIEHLKAAKAIFAKSMLVRHNIGLNNLDGNFSIKDAVKSKAKILQLNNNNISILFNESLK